MGVYYSLAYGVALTDQFGEKLEHIPEELFAFGVAHKQPSKSQKLQPIQSMPTVEEWMLVLGVNVTEGPTDGVTWIDGEDALKVIHKDYLALLESCPNAIRSIINENALVPITVHLIC